MPPNDPDNGWDEYKNLVLNKLEGLEGHFTKKMCELTEQVTQLRIAVAVLKVRAGVWGAAAGVLAAGVPIIVWFLLRAMST